MLRFTWVLLFIKVFSCYLKDKMTRDSHERRFLEALRRSPRQFVRTSGFLPWLTSRVSRFFTAYLGRFNSKQRMWLALYELSKTLKFKVKNLLKSCYVFISLKSGFKLMFVVTWFYNRKAFIKKRLTNFSIFKLFRWFYF